MGFVILLSIVFLPFEADPPNTFLEIGLPLIENIGLIPLLGDPAAITFAYIVAVSFILLVIAGFVGIFPLGTGVLGVVGLALITAAVYFLVPVGVPRPVWGTGYYAMWGASIVSLGASFWHGKSKQQLPQSSPVVVNVIQTQTPTPPPICFNCGAANPPNATYCVKCGRPITKP